jgi:hypothetical protein
VATLTSTIILITIIISVPDPPGGQRDVSTGGKLFSTHARTTCWDSLARGSDCDRVGL